VPRMSFFVLAHPYRTIHRSLCQFAPSFFGARFRRHTQRASGVSDQSVDTAEPRVGRRNHSRPPRHDLMSRVATDDVPTARARRVSRSRTLGAAPGSCE